ncbi:MAG: hypothetical protein LRZ88_12360 [Candidatus Cloacimonetes bacterium]|nr:hypothetical protein [Candidatus Cloacimonadota bacterium]
MIPEPRYIELYRAMGGELFSLGSDAHRLANFGSTLHGLDLLGLHRRPTQHSHSRH